VSRNAERFDRCLVAAQKVDEITHANVIYVVEKRLVYRFCAIVDDVQLKVLKKACSLNCDGLQLGWSKGDESGEGTRGELRRAGLIDE
jgi:hypothetical protein